MIELLNKRSYTAKHFDNGDGSFTMEAYGGHVHYKKDGVLTDSNITWTETSKTFEMTEHNYTLVVQKIFTTKELIKYHNNYEGSNHGITYEPEMLAFVDKTNLLDTQVVATAQRVTGVQDDNKIVYTDAFLL